MIYQGIKKLLILTKQHITNHNSKTLKNEASIKHLEIKDNKYLKIKFSE